MAVIDLVKHTSRDTVKVAEGLLATCLAEGGSLTLVYRSPVGEERIAITGLYASDKALALKAIMKLSMHLTNLEERVRSKP